MRSWLTLGLFMLMGVGASGLYWLACAAVCRKWGHRFVPNTAGHYCQRCGRQDYAGF